MNAISPGLLQELLDLAQWLRGRVLVQDGRDLSGASLHAVDGLPVRPTDSTGLNGVDLVDEAVCLIGQLADDGVPLGEALVAAVTVWEGARESAGAGVTARAGHALHAHTVTAGFVALLLSDAARVAVTR